MLLLFLYKMCIIDGNKYKEDFFMDVNYKNKKRYNTAKYPIRQPWYLTWLITVLSKIMLLNTKNKI